MAVANEQPEISDPVDPFEIDGPSPLPTLGVSPEPDEPAHDAVAAAERAIALADVNPDARAERVAARLELSDAWIALGAIAPALEAARQAHTIVDDEPRVLERLGTLLGRAGAHADAGEAFAALARRTGQAAAWLAAGRAFARAEATDRLAQLLDELSRQAPDDLAVARFGVEVARSRHDPSSDALPPRLMATARLALRKGDAVTAVRCAVDAWIESRGRRGGELAAEALLAQGDEGAAFWIAVDSAARAYAAGDAREVAGLLRAAAQAAQRDDPVETATGVLLAAAVLTDDAATRERARDLLADQGRVLELSARLRADARRASDPLRACAAWKGVAAIEMPDEPSRAAAALGEALAQAPDDAEARELLWSLAGDPEIAPHVHDALFWATRPELPRTRDRAKLRALLGDLCAAAGDAASAVIAYERAVDDDASVSPRLEAAREAAAPSIAQADAAIERLERAASEGRIAAVNALLGATAHTPGAVTDLARLTKKLAPLVASDARLAAFWLRVTRRRGDGHALAGALRRIATRSIERRVRSRATVELAERLDADDPLGSEASDVLVQLLDEQPDALEATAALGALAEHSREPARARASLAALARGATASTAREALFALAGAAPVEGSPLFALARAVDDTLAPREKSDALADVGTLLGESPSLLARRTRALLAQPSEVRQALAVARRFAESVPLSPEATIAWFSATGVVEDTADMTESAIAVVHSLAAARDGASVARVAVARLMGRGDVASAARVGREAAEALGLSDRGLRSAVVDCAQRQPDPAVAIELLECAVAGSAEAPGESLAALRRIAQLHRTRADALGEAHALRRLLTAAPADHEALDRLAVLLPTSGDHRSLARVLSLQLASDSDPATRRGAHLALASLQHVTAGTGAAVVTLDRLADEQPTAEVQGDVVRALVAMGEDDAALERLLRWAAHAPSSVAAAQMYRAAARLERARGGEPARALGYLRQGLVREPESPELLLLAEQMATAARAVRPMLEIYRDLDELAAGVHGRRALAYRRAQFLADAGEADDALAGFLAVFDQAPAHGALSTAIERLATAAGRFDVLVAIYRKLAEGAPSGDGKVRFYGLAARVAREQMHDRRAALELALLAHDVKRDADASAQVIDAARSLRGLDPQAFRHAVETVVDRTIEVADEVWDDVARCTMAMRAAEISLEELADPARAARAAEVYLKGSEDKPAGRAALRAMLDRVGVVGALRDAVERVGGDAPVPRPTTPPTRAQIKTLVPPAPVVMPDEPGLDDAREPGATIPDDTGRAFRSELIAMARAGDAVGALLRARGALGGQAHAGEAALRVLAEDLARDAHDALAEFELVDWRLDRALDPAERRPLVLRAAELLAGELARPDEARHRLEAALLASPDDPELLRGLHEVTEQLAAWPEAAALLARRIARAGDRIEVRALRLHRAAVLEQRLGDAAGACVELEAILVDEPAHRTALRYLADLRTRQGQFRDAGECFARAAATTPERAEAAELLAMAGEAFVRAEDDVAAEAQLRRGLELDPGSTRSLDGLVVLAQRRGDHGALERAVAPVADATRVDAHRVTLKLVAARAALESGAPGRAKGHLDAVRKSAPPGEVARLDALLQEARDNDRPISRTNLERFRASPSSGEIRAVNAPTVPAPAPIEARSVAGSARPPSLVPAPIVPTVDVLATSVATLDTARDTIPGAPFPDDAEAEAIPLSRARAPRPSSSQRWERAPDPVRAAGLIGEAGGYAVADDATLREAAGAAHDGAMRELAARLARTEQGRAEAVRLERERFARDPSRLDALEALVGLLNMLGRGEQARAVRAALDVLSGREPGATPPPLSVVPDPAIDGAARLTLPGDHALIGEVGALLHEALGNAYRRELTSYGVTGLDRVNPTAPLAIARLYAAAARVLQLQRTALFVRQHAVPGGAQPVLTVPPGVVLAQALANESAVSAYVLGSTLESTRPAIVLACALDEDERASLAQAVLVGFGPTGVMSGAPAAVARLARELYLALAPRAQRRLQEVLATLERAGAPFSEARWTAAADAARARAGLLVSGDFAVAARMVVARHARTGGEPDVRGALATMEPLRDLARFAVSEAFVAFRWHDGSTYRSRW